MELSALHLSLATLGACILLGIITQSAWVLYKNKPKQAKPGIDDSLLDTIPTRQDPGFETQPPLGADSSMPMPSKYPKAAQKVDNVIDKKPALDPLIDAIASITLDQETSGDAALAAMPTTRRVGGKPFAIEALNMQTQQWEAPKAGQRYTQFQAGVQLANRKGALNQIEFSEFLVKTQAFADALNAVAEFPDMLQEVARARDLDQFADEHDAQLSFTLKPTGAAWSPGYIQQTAVHFGFVAGLIPGSMVMSSSIEGQPAILVLSFDTQAALAEDPARASIHSVILTLDVPHVLRSEQAFKRMCDMAAALTQAMDGITTDALGQPLQAEALDSIHNDLEALYDTLENHDLSAGSALSRRLFS